MLLLGLLGSTSILFITVLVLLYFYLTRNFNYWKSRGIKGPKPYVGFGTLSLAFFKPLQEVNLECVNKYGKIHGLFLGDRPVLAVADPELVRDCNIKDFHIFVDRNDLKSGDPMNDRSLFNLVGDEWKQVRSIISPTFSSGKMRRMHPIVVDCVHRLENVLEKQVLDRGIDHFDAKRFMSNFTMDVIASCAFGTRIDTYNDEKSQFVVNAQKVFRGTWRLWVGFIMLTACPKLVQMTGFSIFDPKSKEFFKSAITSIISRRRAENTKANDYLQLMINAMDREVDNEEDVEEDKNEDIFRQTDDKSIKSSKVKGEITETDVLATSFVFFVAGFETTATTLSNLLFCLATHEKCQQKLYEELERNGPEFEYEDISRMPYLEACIAETLRLYSPISAVGRMAAEEYTFGNTGITIPKGMLVNFDVYSIHHNPEYYPKPFEWNPERFMPENRDKLVPYTYFPFGMGPRNCVGMRFALMEAKTAAAYLVQKFRFFKTSKTPDELKPKKMEFLFTVDPFSVGFEKRK